jgi:hypothetical protein
MSYQVSYSSRLPYDDNAYDKNSINSINFKMNRPDEIKRELNLLKNCKRDVDTMTNDYLKLNDYQNLCINPMESNPPDNCPEDFYSNNQDIIDSVELAYVCGNTDYLDELKFKEQYGDFYNLVKDGFEYNDKNGNNVNFSYNPYPSPPTPPPSPPTPPPSPPTPPTCPSCPSCPSCQPEKICNDYCTSVSNSTNTKKSSKDMSETKKQLLFSLIGALLFLFLSTRVMYSLTNLLFSKLSLPTLDQNGCPTTFGLILHFLVYFGIIFGIMKLSERFRKN